MPGALIASGNVQWYATRASIKGYLGGDDQMALSLYHDEVVADFAAATRDLNGAPATARAKIAPALAAAQGAFDSSYGIVQARIINAQKMTITTAELFADSRAVSSSLLSLSDLGYSTMAAAVKQRLSQVTTWRNVTAGISAIALGVALALSWLITRALAAPLAQAIDVFGYIAAGKYDNAIEPHRLGRGWARAALAGRHAAETAHPDRERAAGRRRERPHPPGARQGFDLRGARRRTAADHLSQ